jgi:hypothetical protein
MTTRYRRARPPQRRSGCLTGLAVLVWAAIILVALFYFVGRPLIAGYVARQVGGGAQGQLEGSAEGVIPSIVAALPPGEIIVTEEQANEFFAARAGQLGPIESVSVRLLPGQVQADLMAAGTVSQASLGLAAYNGQVVALNPQLSGPLGLAVSADTLASTITDRLNEQLAAQGKQAREVRVEQGRVVIVIA